MAATSCHVGNPVPSFELMRRLVIVEVSPRDGLQNEPVVLSTAAKVELIRRLVAAGARRIEAVSFAHPRLVPAMADAEAVMAAVPRADGLAYAGLVLNRRGLDRAVATGVDEVNVVVGVSDTFSRRNQNLSTDEAIRMAEDVAAAARSRGLFASLTLATAFGCPFEGEVPQDRVVELARRGAGAGFDELCLADTIGVGTPDRVRELTARVREVVGGDSPLRYHFHNTRNTGIANAYAAILDGVTTLDASAGGIGGCPFAPNATGNIATDDLLYMADRMGLDTGLDLRALLPTAAYLTDQLGHPVPAMLPKAGPFP
jgi:isopropylmalate/homocitrate/citramalate synthase